MEFIAAATAVSGLLYKVWAAWRESEEEKSENSLSTFTEAGLEVGSVGSADADHLVVGEVERPLELSQVGGLNVGELRQGLDAHRAGTFKAFTCCGGRLALHIKE